ncbi:MAG: hypothetical protein AAF191_10810 [Verrucomicrobiota bacterium]
MKVRVSSVDEVKAYFASRGKFVLTFAGFSGAGYENPQRLRKIAESAFGAFPVETTIINAGATTEGIGAVYDWAKEWGFETAGIVSTCVLEYGPLINPAVDEILYVRDDKWGGFLENGAGARQLSPTSEAMVSVSDEMIAVGGGVITCDELTDMVHRGKPVRFYRAQMIRNKAVAKALKNGSRLPSSFWGEADEVFRRSEDTGA